MSQVSQSSRCYASMHGGQMGLNVGKQEVSVCVCEEDVAILVPCQSQPGRQTERNSTTAQQAPHIRNVVSPTPYGTQRIFVTFARNKNNQPEPEPEKETAESTLHYTASASSASAQCTGSWPKRYRRNREKNNSELVQIFPALCPPPSCHGCNTHRLNPK